MALPGFIFGGDTGIKSPEDLARARAIAEALLMPQRPAQNVGEGLAVLGQAIRGRREMNAANRAQATGDASASSAIAQALGGGVFPPAPGGGASPVASALSGSGASTQTASAGPPPPISANGDASELAAAFNDPSQRAKLPAGMRNNNPGNIKFVGQAGTRPSANTDQGDPQAVYDSPESGMRAMYGLLQRKYTGGKITANDIIAGKGGWTPGNFQAAANVARNAGLRPDQDINFNDPQMAARFMRGLMLQEHGAASKLYPDSMILSAIGGQPQQAPAVAAVNAEATGQQVASLDPSVGMPSAPSPVAAALQLPQQGPIPQGRPDVAAALNGAPAPQPGEVGGPGATTPAGQRVLGQMMSPLPMGGNAMQMQPPAGAPAAPPLPSSQIAPDPMAAAPQAQPAPDNLPVMAGGSADAIQPGQGGPSVQQLMQAAQNPWLKPEQRALVNGLLAQKMKQNDPATLLEMEKNRLDMEKTRIETERLRNPQMTPAEKARLDLDTQKFQADQKKLMELSPGTTVFDPATRAPVYSAPEKSDVLSPEALAQKLQLSKAGASSVNVDTKGETKYDQTLGEELAKKTIGIMDAGQQAPNKIATYQQMMDVLPGIYTGAGGEKMLTGKKIAKALGFDTGDLSGQEFVQAMGNQMALELRNPAGGAGMPGAMSDSDRAFLSSMSPGLSMTPEGNQKLLQYRMVLEKRNMEVAHQANEYMKTHGGRLDSDFFSGLSDWSNANPLFPKTQPDAGGAKKPTVIDGYTIEPVE